MSTTITEPIGISALGKGSIFLMPLATAIGGTDTAPTIPLAAVTAAVNVTCAFDAGWEPTYDMSRGTRMKYCSTAEFEARGKGKWTGGAFTYEWDPQNPDDVLNYKHVVDLAPDSKYLAGLRLGLTKDVAPAANQYLAYVMPIELDIQVPVNIDPSNDAQVLQLIQQYVITAPVRRNVKIVSGS